MATRVVFEGRRLDSRTRDMFVRARANSRLPLRISQGSYNAGSVSQSAGTHDGGGVIDIACSNLTAVQRRNAVYYLRQVGFAAWLRSPSEGNWPWHIHAVAIGCPDLAPSAARQVTAYKKRRNGLANNGRDSSTVTQFYNMTWEKYMAAWLKANAALPAATGPTAGIAIHTWSLNYATKSKPMSGTTLKDAIQFVAFARSQGLVSTDNERKYHDHLHRGEWSEASAMFISIIKSVQRKARVTVDGIVGRETGGYIDNFGYRVYYNG